MNTFQIEVKKLKSKCKDANSEDDIKIATNIFISKLGDLFNFEVRQKNEYSYVHGGRADSVFNSVIFEYKKLNYFRASKGVNEAVWGRDERDHGLYHYLINSSLQEESHNFEHFKQILFNKVGVGFDGKQIVFTRFKQSSKKSSLMCDKTSNWPQGFPKEMNVDFEESSLMDVDYGTKRLLLYLRSTQKIALTADNLCASFSSKSNITQKTISYLYDLLTKSLNKNSRVLTLYNEWERIFGKIYDETEETQSDFVKITKGIEKVYNLEDFHNTDIKKALFTIQTYYSIIIKLLVQNLFDSLQNPSGKITYVNDYSDLTSLFHGNKSGFNSKVNNFFEIHFFEWFTLTEDIDVNYINDIVCELDKFETTASIIKPEIVQDVLKKTYESITPKELRHLMGEYYTINWLADFTIDHSGLELGKHTSALDPTCGSGTFLMHLINKYIEKFSDKMSYDELVKNIVDNYVGFDINPIAVIQAKGNYILVLGDITKLEEAITIPIYMCDSVLVPTVYAKQKNGDKTISIETSVGDFKLPLLANRTDSDIFLKCLSDCILKDYDVYEDFEGRLKREFGIEIDDESKLVSRELFCQLMKLHHAGKDGFWPIILKNSFAPLFCKQTFDYIVGNPPWIAWKAMSENYRQLSLDIWLSYGIFEKGAYDKITTHDDFAMAVTYVAIDHYLKDNGIAALVLPQTFVKSLKGGEGFRKFMITRDGQQLPFSVKKVFDMLDINPFKGIANNKTSVYVFEKSHRMIYPMDSYYMCLSIRGKSILTSDTYEQVKEKMEIKCMSAKPINEDVRSPWLTFEPHLMHSLSHFLGKSSYAGRKGIEPCGAKGVYLLNVIDKKDNFLKIENCVERSRLQKVKDLGVHTGYVEDSYIYPMVGGRNISKWGINSYIYMFVPHDSGKTAYRGVQESVLKTEYYRSYDWLFYFHDILLETRIRSAKFFDPQQFPWYRLDNVGPYTFSPYKVLWKEQAKAMQCCVVSSITNEFVTNKKVMVDSKVLFVALDNEMEAYYLCGLMNSQIVEDIVKGYTINTNRGVDIVKNINFPKFDSNNPNHVAIANASKRAHEAYKQEDEETISQQEILINQLVPVVFGAIIKK